MCLSWCVSYIKDTVLWSRFIPSGQIHVCGHVVLKIHIITQWINNPFSLFIAAIITIYYLY